MREPVGQNAQCGVLAEEAAQEKDPRKLIQIIEALTRALDERDGSRNGNGNSHKQGAT